MGAVREIFAGGDMSIELIVWALYVGLLLAAVIMLLEKRAVGKLVRKLDEAGALSPENGKTLAELGLAKNPFVKGQLRGKTALSALVYAVGETPEIDEEGHATPVIRKAVDPAAKYYLPEPLRNRALLRYSTRGSHAIDIVVAVIGFGIIGWLLIAYLPKLLALARDILGIG